MGRIASGIHAAAMLAAVAGCGTLANLEGKEQWCLSPTSRSPYPFGGVRNDSSMFTHAVQRAPGDGACAGATLALIDMPFSLVADIVTLPWTCYLFEREKRNPSEKYANLLETQNQTGRYDRFPIRLRQDVANITAATPATDSITQTNFDKIKVGMSQSDIEAILGRVSDKRVHPGGTLGDRLYSWVGSSAIITVTFGFAGNTVEHAEITAM